MARAGLGDFQTHRLLNIIPGLISSPHNNVKCYHAGVSGASNMPRKRESLAPEVIELLLISKSMLDRVDTEMRKAIFLIHLKLNRGHPTETRICSRLRPF
jgi:hypothetical protein